MSVSEESTRTRLIREMARDMNRQRIVPTSDRGFARDAKSPMGSTTSSFDPDNEAVVSTRPLNIHPQALPELRDSAKKYRYPRQAEPEVQINTSAIHRAFPDFTQGPSSDNESMSIEIGRGNPANRKTHKEANSSLMDFGADGIEDSIQHDSNLTPANPFPYAFGGYSGDAAYSPNPKREAHTSMSQSSQPAPSGFSSANDLVHRLSHTKQSKMASQIRKPGSQSSTNKASIQAPADITDMPNISELVSGIYEDGTPVFSAMAPRSALPPKYGRKSKLSHVELASIPTPDDEQAIYISLKLLQEKVASLEAGKVEDAAALASLRADNESLIREKHERQRSKRSDSALGSTSGSDGGDEAGLGARKLAIEKARVESRLQRTQEELKEANVKYQISSETIRSITRERDSATTQLGVAYLTTERLKAEMKVLEDENEHLKIQLLAALEANVSRNEGMSYVRASNSQAVPTSTETSNRVTELDDQDHTELLNFNVSNVAAPEEPAPPANRRYHTSIPPLRAAEIPKNSRQRPLAPPGQMNDIHGSSAARPNDESSREPLYKPASAAISQRTPRDRPNSQHEHQNSGKSSDARNARDDAVTADRRTTGKSNPTKAPLLTRANLPEDMTILSNENGSGVNIPRDLSRMHTKSTKIELFPEIRAMLENARRAKKFVDKRRQEIAEEEQQASRRQTTAVSLDDMAAMRRKSSKDASKRLSLPTNSKKIDEQNDLTGISKVSFKAMRQSDNSLLEQKSRRKGFAMEDMTSAYIVPDITLRHPATAAKSQFGTKRQPERAVEPYLKTGNIGHRILEHRKPQEHKDCKTLIRKPVPPSERMPSPTPSNPDPTMRPSEAPGLSLARVIKALNEEILVLKERLRVLESASYYEDAGMSKRQRVERERQITMLRKAKNSKSDQVYYLMNVLEGQKVAGQEMTQDEVEVTLQSAGVDSAKLDFRMNMAEDEDITFDSVAISDDLTDSDLDVGPSQVPASKRATVEEDLSEFDLRRPSENMAEIPIKSALKKPSKYPWDDLGETEELPWEGFESTGHATSRSRRSSGSRHHQQQPN